MTSSSISLLLDRATDGVDTDEITLRRTEEGYWLSVTGTSYEHLSEEDVHTILSSHPAVLREWRFWHVEAPQGPARWAFLRWLEDADGTLPPNRLAEETQRIWGQLCLTIRLDDEEGRAYEVRHVDDADQPSESLIMHTDPLDARELAKYDDNGQYRPLSTAPTLQTGWVFSGLDPAALLRTVDLFYPATIANWHRERTGELDVTHWTEATNRQTGIYAVTSELRESSVDWVAEACCVDSQCLKRRQWEERADRELPVPRGDGAFPCREPCSLVIAAARKWALLEREDEHAYTFHLTPSEKEQLETLLDAVAEETVDDIREADVGNGANRYRARFLRAKRRDERGPLDVDSSADE